MSKEDQRAIDDTDLLEEEKKKDEGDPLSLDNIDDDDDDGDDDDGDGRDGDIDNKVEATDEYSNGERSAYPNDGDKQGADGTAKKRKMNSSPGDSGATMTEKNDDLAVLDNNETLLVEVASFVPRGLTLGNICVALGSGRATLLRKTYLNKNYRFLEEAMRGFRTATWRTWGKQKCADDVRHWMKANDDWETVCDSILVRRTMRCPFPRDSVAFFQIFNPIGGIELGLLEILKFFVEGNMNEYIRSYGPHREEEISEFYDANNLLRHSFREDNFEAFEYLLSRVGIVDSDLLVSIVYDQRHHQNNDRGFVIDSTKYFEAIVEHPEFSPNAEILVDGTICSPLSLIISSFYDDFSRGCFRGGLLKKLSVLLEAGADPNLPTLLHANGFGVHATPLELARILRDQPMFSTWRPQWQAVVDVITDHSLVRSMAELSLHS